MTFVKKIFQSKIGTSSIYEPNSRSFFQLPNGLKIFNRRENTWIGGSEDGQVIVHVERITQELNDIPTVLAEGDLDLFLCSDGPVESTESSIKEVQVNGSFANTPIKGYLAVVKIIGNVAYLVLTATKAISDQIDLKGISLDIIGRINQAHKH